MAVEGAPSLVVVPEIPAAGADVELHGDEAHYLRRVVRVRAGERVGASDGAGTLATLEVIEVGERVRARCLARELHVRDSTLELWCGAPEGDRADWMVEKLAELGAAALQPLDTRRGRWERFEARRGRWERLCTAAMRQSRSAFRMAVRRPLPLDRALNDAGAATARWLCDPGGGAPAPALLASPGTVVVAVGPSSGFSAEELNALSQSGFLPLRLAATRLRAETAAVAAAALWAAARPAAPE